MLTVAVLGARGRVWVHLCTSTGHQPALGHAAGSGLLLPVPIPAREVAKITSI